ncbi:MAG: DUF4867 family protein [Lachnospiraceae bacterium]|nr:DUF4867 family protein [Lachnospiraceae bacterium]
MRNIYSVTDAEFLPYGKVLEGYETAGLVEAMRQIALPDQGTAYKPGIASLESEPILEELRDRAYGGMPVQLGMCWGRNTKLNCLEYHKDSEINIGTEEFVLLLAKLEEVEDGVLDTAKVKAFRVPAGTVVEVYATTLHYAPCHLEAEKGFRVAVALPKGTNTDKPECAVKNAEDKLLWARNKWLLAHADSAEAKQGAYIGLTGENPDLDTFLTSASSSPQ